MDNQVFEEKILKVDKSKWKLTKLGTLAEDISVRVDKPGNSEYDRFVGLDNFVSGDIKIKSWASTKSLTSSAKAFKAGDILFARRNAYLRRASLVDFDGCCSGDAFVIRENLDKVVPGYLAFLMNSNSIWDYANSNAAGTMSKRVKWRDLAEYEFLLPPKAEQARLTELLWALDEVIEKEKEVLVKVEYQSQVYLNKSFRYGAYLNKGIKETPYGPIPENWELRCLKDLGEFKNGINKGNEDFGFGYPFVNLLDLFGFKELYNKDFGLVNVNENELKQFDVRKGDVMFIRSSVKPSGVGLTTIIQEDLKETVYSGFIIRFRPFSAELSHIFKKYCFYEDRFRCSLIKRSTVSANTNINQESLNKLLIPVPPIEEQKEFNRVMSECENVYKNTESKISASQFLQKSLINQLF